MRATITKDLQESEFPRLMILKDDEGEMIVLFVSKNRGMVVYNSCEITSAKLGHISDAWEISVFKPFYGSVELHNH